MELLKKVGGIVIGFAVAYFAIQYFTGSDKLAPFHEFRSDEGRFIVLMPGKPESQNQTLETPVGQVQTIMYTAGSSKTFCTIAYADYPAQLVNSTDPQKLLGGATNGAVKNVNGRLVSEISTNFHGLPAKDVWIEVPKKFFITARFIMADSRFYELMFITPKEKGQEADIKKFFDSFKIDGIK